MSRRYIEIASGYRNRNNWPCPGDFIVPVDCQNRSNTPLEANDKLMLGYPSYGWYQVPYASPLWTDVYPEPLPRNINGIYYTSLWPLVPTLDQTINFTPALIVSKNFGWIGAQQFSGGTKEKPLLNSVVVTPPNIWSALPSGGGSNINFNPYYTPLNNYFAGAKLFRFTSDPSCSLNAWDNYQTVVIAVAFAVAPQIGDEIGQAPSSVGNIICINSATSFVVVLRASTTPAFTPAPAPNIVNNASGNSSAPGSFSSTLSLPFRYDGKVESSIIVAYNAKSGAVTLETPFSDDFDPNQDFYLIDFNTDPNDDWSDFVKGGPRIFVPGGSSAQQAYEGLYFENYTISSENNTSIVSSQVIKYDRDRKLAYLDSNLPIINSTSATNNGLYGSNSFVIRKQLEISSKTYERISIISGAILTLDVQYAGSGYQVGETIGTTFNTYFSSPGTATTYPAPNYIIPGPGTAFRGIIKNIDANGGIIDIEVVQEGSGYIRGQKYYLSVNIVTSSGQHGTLLAPRVYQALEIYRSDLLDNNSDYDSQSFVFLPEFGQINTDTGLQDSNRNTIPPSMPRYFFPPNSVGVTSATNLDIRQNGYPPSMTCVNGGNYNVPETGSRQIISSFQKTITFGDWWATAWIGSGSVLTPITVIYLNCPFSVDRAGLTDLGNPAFIRNVNIAGGYLVQQAIEFLGYSGDNMHPLNFTGTRVGQNQMVCYEIELISITLPNLPLDNTIGGLVAFYPYFYVELSNVNAPSRGNKGIIYSNNPNANRALFRVSVNDTNTPLRSSFIKLNGDGAKQTVKFRPNDDLHFRVSIFNGITFQTLQKDTSPPLPPDFFVQISALFQIKRLI